MPSKKHIAFVIIFFAGCTSLSVKDPIKEKTPSNEPIKASLCVKSSAKLNAISEKFGNNLNSEEYSEKLSFSVSEIDSYLRENIYSGKSFILSSKSSCEDTDKNSDSPEDLYLVVDLSGYGSAKEEWKKILIGTGIAEGVAQGYVVIAASGSVGLGLAVAAEEMISEYLVWNGADWFLGETYAPVTLDAKLIYLKENKVIWQDSYFIRENDEELSGLSKEEKSNRQKQLQASLHKAEKNMVFDINKYLLEEVAK